MRVGNYDAALFLKIYVCVSLFALPCVSFDIFEEVGNLPNLLPGGSLFTKGLGNDDGRCLNYDFSESQDDQCTMYNCKLDLGLRGSFGQWDGRRKQCFADGHVKCKEGHFQFNDAQSEAQRCQEWRDLKNAINQVYGGNTLLREYSAEFDSCNGDNLPPGISLVPNTPSYKVVQRYDTRYDIQHKNDGQLRFMYYEKQHPPAVCLPCPAGRTPVKDGGVSGGCEACPAGTYSPKNGAKCRRCPHTRDVPNEQQTGCVTCTDDQWPINDGTTCGPPSTQSPAGLRQFNCPHLLSN